MEIGSRFLVLSYVYSKQPIFGLTQECLREVWSPRQGICLFTPVWDIVESQVFTPNIETCLVRESNYRPAACQADVLTTTLPRLSLFATNAVTYPLEPSTRISRL